MRALITGKGGRSGSWAVRGEQLGRAIGATVKPMATRADCEAHDLIVVVKRLPETVLQAIRESGRPWVFDPVDCYPQPRCSQWTPDWTIAWMRALLATASPAGVIWPNARMQQDVGFNGRQLVLPHHARPGSRINPVRQSVARVGYEGSERYLGPWREFFEAECKRRGWQFVASPAELADLDIVVAYRGGEWNGYAQRHWKSNVKLANAQATGTPFIGAREDGYLETACGAEFMTDDEEEIRAAMDQLTDPNARAAVSTVMQDNAPRLGAIGNQLRAWLSSNFSAAS